MQDHTLNLQFLNSTRLSLCVTVRRPRECTLNKLFLYNTLKFPVKAIMTLCVSTNSPTVNMAEEHQLKAVSIKRGKNAPIAMCRGAAAAGDGKCYFMSEDKHELWMYDVAKNDWFSLRQCPYKNTSLAVINNLITAVGGQKGEYGTNDYEFANNLYSLSNRRWAEKFPPLNCVDSKSRAAVVQSESSLIVIAGVGKGGFESRVDILDTKSSKWSEAPELPKGSPFPSAAVCGDELYMMNGGGWGGWVFKCLLDELIGDTKSTANVWSKKADAPFQNATCASFYGQLVAVGGNRGTSGSETPTINAYDANKDSWYEIGKLASGRSQPLVAQLSEDTLIVVGGIGQTGETVTEIVTGIL